MLAAIYSNFLSQNKNVNLQNFNITFTMSSGIKIKLIQNSMTSKTSTQKSCACMGDFLEELLYHRISSMSFYGV